MYRSRGGHSGNVGRSNLFRVCFGSNNRVGSVYSTIMVTGLMSRAKKADAVCFLLNSILNNLII